MRREAEALRRDAKVVTGADFLGAGAAVPHVTPGLQRIEPGMDRAGGGRWLRWKEIRATLINIEIPLMPKHGAPRGSDPWSTGKGHIAQ